LDPTVSIVIPAYNAAQHLPSVIFRFPSALWNSVRNVWIVNDGSTDNTDAVIASLARDHSSVHPIGFKENRGYGAAMRKGLISCLEDGCDFAAVVHADGQYPPEEVLHFVETMTARSIDLMQGSRLASGTALAGGMPLYKYLAGRTLTMLENTAFGLRMSDYHSGFLVYRRAALAALPFASLSRSFDFDLEAIACARAQGLTIGELPIPTRYADEKSYLNPLGYGLRVLRVLAKYKSGFYHKIRAQDSVPQQKER
jgi:glycosyltransferase involved in cell wall biosynthesis